jgi:hypothetical protein
VEGKNYLSALHTWKGRKEGRERKEGKERKGRNGRGLDLLTCILFTSYQLVISINRV